MTDGSETEADTVSVALATPLLAAYDYHLGDFGQLVRGTIVLVPLGRRSVHGIILGPGNDDVPRWNQIQKIAGKKNIKEVPTRIERYTLPAA